MIVVLGSARTDNSGSNKPAYHNFLRKVCDRPEEKHDGCGTRNGRHAVDPPRYIFVVAHGEQSENSPQKEKERSAGRVSGFKSPRAGDVFSAIPEAGGWFQRADVDNSCDEEHGESADVVEDAVLGRCLHWWQR